MVAQELGWRFVDTDEQIEEREGQSIPELFSTRGEAYFRQVEREIVQAACRRQHLVISTGGGAVLDPLNRAAMREGNLVVWLRACPETLYRRLRAQVATRPLLRSDDPLGRLKAMEAERRPYYEEVCHLTIDTDERTPQEVAVLLWEYVRQWKKKP
jgi:shikimate kinase